jgi:hypothetical protein
LKLSSRICASEGTAVANPSRAVFTTAKTRPVVSACTALMLRWSSACLSPRTAGLTRHVPRAVPSSWTAQYTVPSSWLLHRMPIRFRPKATTEEMSSGDTVLPATGSTNGLPHVLSPPTVAFA